MKTEDAKIMKKAQIKKATDLRKATANSGQAKKEAKRKRQDSVDPVVDISQDTNDSAEEEVIHEKRPRVKTEPLNYGQNIAVPTPKQAKAKQAKVATKTPPSNKKKQAKKPAGGARDKKKKR